MRVSLSFSYRDVWNSIKYSFSFKKLWVQLRGMLIGVLFYSVMAYIALILSGFSFGEIWYYWKFIPIPLAEPLSVAGWIFLTLGIIGLVVSNYIHSVAVAKITVEQLRGDEFYEIKDALKFAYKRGFPVITTPLSIAFVFAFIILGGVILGLLGKIPYLGEIILLLAAIPAIVMCFFLVYLFLSFVLSLILSPSVVASTESDTFDTLFEVFSTLNEQPFRFILYQFYVSILSIFTTSIFAWALGRAVWIMNSVLGASWLMGAKYQAIKEAAMYFLPSSPIFVVLYPYFRFLGIGAILSPSFHLPAAGGLVNLVGFFFGLGLYIMILLVVSQLINSYTIGTLVSYMVIAKRKDDIDLLEIKKEESGHEVEGGQGSN